jgi:DNA-binding response OmpR family regulator
VSRTGDRLDAPVLRNIQSMGAAHAEPQEATVLVVEDDRMLRSALCHGLEAEGFAVHAVASAAEAHDVLDRVRPDAVLLDWWLGDGEMGAVACRRIADRVHGPVVMHTGMSDTRDRVAAFRAGAAAFLQKGIPLDELAARLRRLIAETA